MASASGYNHHRFARSVLKKSRKWEASLTVELHPSYWKFHTSPTHFGYDHPLRPFLLALRSQVIPAALLPFLYEIQPPISFVDGCLVIQVNDHRRSQEAVQTRVVMRPAAEGLSQMIDLAMQQKGEPWDDQFALEAESRIINATTAPLYLGTSPLAARNANLALSLTAPAHASLSADGRIRDPHSTESAPTDLGLGVGSVSDRMRALLKATDRPSSRFPGTSGTAANPSAFTSSWLVINAKQRYEQIQRSAASKEAADKRREANAQASAAAAIANSAVAALANGPTSAPPVEAAPTEAEPAPQPTPAKPKPKKKKRPAADEDTGPTGEAAAAPAAPAPAPKKKKSAATKKAEIAAAQAAQAAADEAAANAGKPVQETEEKKPVVEEKPKPKPKKKKAAAKQEE